MKQMNQNLAGPIGNMISVQGVRQEVAPSAPLPKHRLTRALRRLRVTKRRTLNTPRGGGRMGLGFTALLIGVVSAGETGMAPGSLLMAVAGVLSFIWGARRAPGGLRAHLDLQGRRLW